MIKPNYVSEILPYVNSCASVEGSLLGAWYNEYLCTAPRQWRTSVDWINALFYDDSNNRDDYNKRIYVYAVVKRRRWPGWAVSRWAVNASTGAVEETLDESSLSNWGGVNTSSMVPSRGGYVYLRSMFGWTIARMDWQRDTLVADDNGVVLPDTTVFAIDEVQGIAVGPSSGVVTAAGLVDNHIVVYSLTDGSIIRFIYVGGKPDSVALAQGTSAYALFSDGRLVLFDHVSGEIFSVTSLGAEYTSWNGVPVKFTYDRTRNRLLFLPQSPDATDGQSTLRIRGYIDQPLPVRLMKPIPLNRSRVGEPTRFLTRVYGDTGEVFSRANVSAVLANNKGSIYQSTLQSDLYGDATFSVKCREAGSETITVSTTV